MRIISIAQRGSFTMPSPSGRRSNNLDDAREAIVADIRSGKAASRIAGEFMDNIERMAG